MSLIEDKWKANQEKVLFLKQFPGLITDWEKTIGLSVQSIVALPSSSKGVILVFSDGSFAVATGLNAEPRDLIEGITAARNSLEPFHAEAYIQLDRLTQIDQEAARQARLENILGAIDKNLPAIPELKDRLRALVKEWDN